MRVRTGSRRGKAEYAPRHCSDGGIGVNGCVEGEVQGRAVSRDNDRYCQGMRSKEHAKDNSIVALTGVGALGPWVVGVLRAYAVRVLVALR